MKYVSDLSDCLVSLDEVEKFIDWAENNLCHLSEWDKVKLEFCYKAIDCVDLPPQRPIVTATQRGE